VLDRGKSGGRADDNEETVVKRIKTCASFRDGTKQFLVQRTPKRFAFAQYQKGFDAACVRYARGSPDKF